MKEKSELSKLFSSIGIGGAKLKNRIVMAPMVTLFGAPDGFMTEREKDYFVRRARGDIGLVTVGDCTIVPNCQVVPAYDGIWDDKFIPSWMEFVRSIHDAGSKVSVQLTHSGSQCQPAITGEQPVAPSAFVSPLSGQMTRQLSIGEIEGLIEKWAEAAMRAREAGIDLVEIQGSQGFLLHNFMTPLFNKRTDEYGGDLKGRVRFPVEVIRRVKEKTGGDYPVVFRMVVSDLVDGGLTLEDTKAMAPMLVDAGADALHFTAGAGLHLRNLWAPPVDAGTGCIVDLAAQLRTVVEVPVIVAQRIIDPFQAETILEDGKADMIALGRALICDPDWARKAAEGTTDDIRKCIGCCQGCLDRTRDGKHHITCLHNPEVGAEKDYGITPVEASKKVMVIGGGPAGMEVAKVAAERGHVVTLYEKDGELGGQWILACIPPKKGEFREVIRYNLRELEKLGVKIELNKEVTPELVDNINPDVVVVATGAVPFVPELPGMKRKTVVTAHDVLSGRASGIGNKVAVLGGGLVGCETADFLVDQGKKVTIVEMLDEIAKDVGPVRKPFLMNRLTDGDVEMITAAKVESITEQGTVGIEQYGKKTEVGPYETIILALGSKPSNKIAKQIEGNISKIYVIGDALEPRKAIDAIAEAAKVGREI